MTRWILAASALAITGLIASCATSNEIGSDISIDIDSHMTNYQVVNPIPQWALTLCSVRTLPPAQPLVSQSRDSATHGGKLYYLKTNDILAYYASISDGETPPDGLVLVKDSFKPDRSNFAGESLTDEQYFKLAHDPDRPTIPTALFVMKRFPLGTPGTHDGWGYATFLPDPNTTADTGAPQWRLNEAGALESCIKCHQDAPHHGLFGLPSDPADDG